MMKRRDLLLATGAALSLSSFPLGWAAADDQKQRKLLMFTRSQGFEHSACKRDGDVLAYNERVVTELGKKHGFDVVATKDGRVFDSDLSGYDAFLFYTTGDLTNPDSKDMSPPMSEDGKQRLLDAVHGGTGFLASHCGADTFHSPGPGKENQPPEKRDPYIAMLGGEFIRHGKQQKGRLAVVDHKFPGLAGLGDELVIPTEEWYSLKNFADNLHVLLVLDTQGMHDADYERPPFPSTWARKHGDGRVFYTAMGHREDVWDNADFQTVLLGGLAWTFCNVEADVTPNIKQVTPGADVMPPI
ncbi:MAG TPA: ThuA domain-containing protein [Pirellulales bacterium]|nr:ThuA domain-containing protein [Pirellulales bacterium]